MKKIVVSMLLIATLLCGGVSAADFEFTNVVNTRYDMLERFSEGYAAVKIGEKWGYTRDDGEICVPIKYDIAGLMSEGKALVGTLSENGNYDVGYIDSKGTETKFVLTAGDKTEKQAQIKADSAKDMTFYGGLLKLDVVGVGTVYFGVDGKDSGLKSLYHPTDGRKIFQSDATSASPIVVQDVQGNMFKYSGVPDENGYKAYKMYPYNQGLAMVGRAHYTQNPNNSGDYIPDEYGFGFVDYTGKFVIAPEYNNFYKQGMYDFRIFSDRGLASVEKDGKYGAINKAGEVVVPFVYDALFAFDEGLAPFKRSGSWGVVDVYGKEVVKPKYRGISGFKNGIAVVSDGFKSFCIDRTGGTIEGSEMVDTNSYIEVIKTQEGDVVNAYTVENVAVTQKDGRYGFGKITYAPPMPGAGDMDTWAFDGVVESIKNGIVPSSLQNMYREKATRYDIAKLMCNMIEHYTGKSIEAVVEEKTGKAFIELINKYPFYDTYERETIAANALGILKGVDGNMFLPHDYISRQDTAVIIMRTAEFLKKNTTAAPVSLTDSAQVMPYAVNAVNYVASAGIMNGVGGSWGPLQNITRQEAYITFFRLFNNIK